MGPGILWGYQTIKQSTIEELPFRLAFRREAIYPIEIELHNLRIQSYDELVNEINLRAQKDIMEEMNNKVNKRITANQYRIERYYN